MYDFQHDREPRSDDTQSQDGERRARPVQLQAQGPAFAAQSVPPWDPLSGQASPFGKCVWDPLSGEARAGDGHEGRDPVTTFAQPLQKKAAWGPPPLLLQRKASGSIIGQPALSAHLSQMFGEEEDHHLPVQRKGDGDAETEDVHRAAQKGVAGSGGPLPYLDQIQRSFGPGHDLSQIQAHVGGDAAEASRSIGAEAYATGSSVAFRESPSLHTAAHEAAHVVQQQHGVKLRGGVGEVGDEYEKHADAVADRVVAGQSARDLLPRQGSATANVFQREFKPYEAKILSLADIQSEPDKAKRQERLKVTQQRTPKVYPGRDSQKGTDLTPGTNVTVIDRWGGEYVWLKIKEPPGWVHGEFVKRAGAPAGEGGSENKQKVVDLVAELYGRVKASDYDGAVDFLIAQGPGIKALLFLLEDLSLTQIESLLVALSKKYGKSPGRATRQLSVAIDVMRMRAGRYEGQPPHYLSDLFKEIQKLGSEDEEALFTYLGVLGGNKFTKELRQLLRDALVKGGLFGPLSDLELGSEYEKAVNDPARRKAIDEEMAKREENSSFGTALPKGPPAAGRPGTTSVSPDVALKILENYSRGEPPFRPELGKGGASWFVTEGTPYVGIDPAKNINVEVEIAKSEGALVFDEAALQKLHEQTKTETFAEAMAKYRQHLKERYGVDPPAELSKRRMKDFTRWHEKFAESRMWDKVGEQVAGSSNKVGEVILENSKFSKGGNGKFAVVSDPAKIKLRDGPGKLIEALEKTKFKAEPLVIEAAEATAKNLKWAGRVRTVFRVGGKLLIVVAVAADVWKIYRAEDKVKAVIESVGGWTGATAAGAAFAAWWTPADVAGPWAWAAHGVGTLIAGGIGYWVGSKVTRTIYEIVVEE